jgi:hypothetical protein
MFIKLCHTETEILEFANSQLKQANSKIVLSEVTGHSLYSNHIEFKTNRGAKAVAVIFNRSPSQLSIKSILKIKNKARHATWLINGQASKNTDQLVFNGECGKTLQAPLDRFEQAVYDAITNPDWSEEKKQNHVKETMAYERKSIVNVDNLTH